MRSSLARIAAMSSRTHRASACGVQRPRTGRPPISNFREGGIFARQLAQLLFEDMVVLLDARLAFPYLQADKYDQLVDVIEAAKTDRKIGAASPAVPLLRIFKD